MATDDSFANLMSRLQCGDDAAARAVFTRFTHRLVGLAKKHLSGRLAVKVDPEDVVQSAYKSFFQRHQGGNFDIASWDGLWGLMTVITLRKCADRAAYFRSEKRQLNREVIASADSTPAAWQLAVDRDPIPEEAVILSEAVEDLFQTLSDPDEQAILELSLQGFTAIEVSEKLGRAERSVRRLRERIRKRLERDCHSFE